MKVKMLARHGAPWGKLEKGLTYDLEDAYAQELMKHGLAVLVVETVTEAKPFEVVPPEPGFVNVNRTPPKAKKTMKVFNKGGRVY